MIETNVTPTDVVEFLNNLLKIDPVSIGNIFGFRVPCNKDLADHPTVQVGCEKDFCQVGIVGILNGLFGVHEKSGWGCISIIMDNGIAKGFAILDENGTRARQ